MAGFDFILLVTAKVIAGDFATSIFEIPAASTSVYPFDARKPYITPAAGKGKMLVLIQLQGIKAGKAFIQFCNWGRGGFALVLST